MLLTSKGTLYTGMTNDLLHRLHAHASKTSGSKYIRGCAHFSLVYVQECQGKSEALSREYEIKIMPRNKKELLLTAVTNKVQHIDAKYRGIMEVQRTI